MAISFSCPRCDRQYSVSDQMAGRRVTCKACGQEFSAPKAAATPVAAPIASAAYEEVLPSPRSRSMYEDADDDREDYRPPARVAARVKKKKRSGGRSSVADMNVGQILGGYFGLNALSFGLTVALGATGQLQATQAGYYFGLFFGLSSMALILGGIVSFIIVLCNDGISETARPIVISSVGGACLLAPFLLASAGGFRPWSGDTPRSRQAVQMSRELAQLLGELNALTEQIDGPESAARLAPQMQAIQARYNDLKARMNAVNLTRAEKTYHDKAIEAEMRPQIERALANARRLNELPHMRGMLTAGIAEMERELARLKGGSTADAVSNYGNVSISRSDSGGAAAPQDAAGAASPPNGSTAPPQVAFTPPPEDPKIPEGVDPVTKSLLQLKSSRKHERREALDRLQRTRPNEQLDEVVQVLLPILQDDDGFTVVEAMKALTTWTTPEVVPALCDRLEDNRFFVRHEAIRALAKLKDPRGLKPIVARLKEDRGEVGEALKNWGPEAETALIERLTDPDKDVRRGACEILRDVGGVETLKAMSAMKPDPDDVVRLVAQHTMETITRRVGPLPTSGRPRAGSNPFRRRGN